MTLYLATCNSPAIRAQIRAGHLGQLVAPGGGSPVQPGARWAADNGCFGKGYPGEGAWMGWLERLPRAGCLFAVAPDVVGEAAATLERSAPWLPLIRELGMPAALVAQDGLEDLPVPWDTFDALFIGGTTSWKLGAAASALLLEAKARGKWTHGGRVNSRRRYLHFDLLGADSVDGTYLAFGPDKNLPAVLSWQATLR